MERSYSKQLENISIEMNSINNEVEFVMANNLKFPLYFGIRQRVYDFDSIYQPEVADNNQVFETIQDSITDFTRQNKRTTFNKQQICEDIKKIITNEKY